MRLSPITTPNFTNNVKNTYNKVSFAQKDPLNSHDRIEYQKNKKNIFNILFTKMKESCSQSAEWINDTYQKSVNYAKSLKNKSVDKTGATVTQKSVKNNVVQIPDFKPSFDIVLLKNIVEKKPEITNDWVQSHPKSILTILNAIDNVILSENSKYKSIDEFKQMFPSLEMQTTIIKTLLTLPNILENAENKIKAEKKQYIESIWEEYIHVDLPYVPFNKEKNILGLKALQKYGTTEDLRKLPREYITCEDNDIFLEYAKLVNKVGSDKADDIQYSDFVNLSTKVNRKDNTYSMDVMEEIMDALKKHWVDDAPKGEWTNASWNTLMNYEHYIRKAQKEGRPQMAANARAIFDRIVEDNPWMVNEVAKDLPQYAKKLIETFS